MSRTFVAEKADPASPAEVRTLRLLWRLCYRGLLPTWIVRLWMYAHGWTLRPLIEFNARRPTREVIDGR